MGCVEQRTVHLVKTELVETRVPDALLVHPKEPVRNASNIGGVFAQLDGYKGAYAQCTIQLDAIAERQKPLPKDLPHAPPAPRPGMLPADRGGDVGVQPSQG
jgi:hypothetical protein